MVSATAAAQGDTVRSAGYGRTATDWTLTTAHTGTFSVETVGDNSLDVLGSTEQSSICKGDAGGPVLRQVNETVELVGVNSNSWQHSCFDEDTTKRGATVARTDNVVGWLNSGMLDPTATPGSKHAINLDWSSVPDATEYRVYGVNSPEVPLEESALLATTGKTAYTHGALPAEQTWHYRVEPVTANGESKTASEAVETVSP